MSTAPHNEEARVYRAVVLDYGKVLCHEPLPAAVGRIANLFGVSRPEFWTLYEKDRETFDRGDMTPAQYWRRFAAEVAIELDDGAIEKLRGWDIEMWTEFVEPMLDWAQRLHSAGYKMALLSNLHLRFARHLRKTAPWLKNFDYPIFSSEVGLAKPDPAIFRLCVRALEVPAQEILFVDDREANVRSAKQLGIEAICFRSVDTLSVDLRRLGFEILP